MIVPRTCSLLLDREDVHGNHPKTVGLSDLRNNDAYVLLGSAGSGKTTAFKSESEKHENGKYVSVCDFLAIPDASRSDSVLFIDGLDEIRANTHDGRTSLDQIRRQLNELGITRFRLSCRELHWLGKNDREKLQKLLPDKELVIARLDSLSDDDVRLIVESKGQSIDIDQFLNAAKEQNIEFLLRNPQTLNMVLKTYPTGELPQSKAELFEEACRLLVKEFNEEHEIAEQSQFSDARLLKTAGRLCTVLLLTASAGFARLQRDRKEEFISPYLEDDDLPLTDRVLKTRLFELESEGHTKPIHRGVAEYLSARHLTELTRDKLPMSRLLATIVGRDGGIANNLHGLIGWLATLSRSCRPRLIKAEPIGILVESDLREFSQEENILLFHAVTQSIQRHPKYWETVRVPEIAKKLVRDELKGFFKKRLESVPGQDDVRKISLTLTLLVLKQSEFASRFNDSLMQIVRNAQWPSHMRRSALDVVIQGWKDSSFPVKELKDLLTNINDGFVEDKDYELVGTLLESLYPSHLDDVEVWRCHRTPQHFFIGQYWRFWNHSLLNRYIESHGVGLLDGYLLFQNREHFIRDGNQDLAKSYHSVLFEILYRTLSNCGESLNVDQILGWFDAIERTNVSGYNHYVEKSKENLAAWFNKHPETHRNLISKQVTRLAAQSSEDELPRRLAQLINKLYDMSILSGDTPDYSDWYVRQSLESSEEVVAHVFLRLSAEKFGPNLDSTEDPRLEPVLANLEQRNDLRQDFISYLDDRIHAHKSLKTKAKAVEKQRNQWVVRLVQHLPSFRKLEGERELLHALAKAYYGMFSNVQGDLPRERLLLLLGYNEGLVDLVTKNFKNAINRDDAPSVEQVLDLAKTQRMDSLTYAITAGMHESNEELVSRQIILEDEKVRLALALYLLIPHYPLDFSHADATPNWVQTLFKLHPELAEEIVVTITTNSWPHAFKLGIDLGALLSEIGLEQVTNTVCFTLLEKFPVRAGKDKTHTLTTLLQRGFKTDENRLSYLVEKKLKRKSMLMACRLRWVVAGLFASIPECRKIIATEIKGREHRIREFSSAILDWVDDSYLSNGYFVWERLDVGDYQLLVETLGEFYDFNQTDERLSNAGEFVSHDMSVAHLHYGLIPKLINRLAANDSDLARESLLNLRQNHHIESWHGEIEQAINDQLYARIEKSKVELRTNDVLALLDSGPPINAEDLVHIVVDQIDELCDRIRNGNASDWKQYWTTIKDGNPKGEIECRDAFLSDLQFVLARYSGSISAEPEAEYGDDKRADICVTAGGIRLPIEVKKDTSPDLWTGIQNQLVKRYVSDPSSHGLGLYLVFWFGFKPVKNVRGTSLINSPIELKRELVYNLDEQHRQSVKICVVDVSIPTRD